MIRLGLPVAVPPLLDTAARLTGALCAGLQEMLEVGPPVPRLWLAQHLLKRNALNETARRAQAHGVQSKSASAPNAKPRTSTPRGESNAAAATDEPQPIHTHETGENGQRAPVGSGSGKPKPEWSNKVTKQHGAWETAES